MFTTGLLWIPWFWILCFGDGILFRGSDERCEHYMSIEIKEIDDFDGDEIAVFINRVFREHYRGRSMIPQWTPAYLQWNIACSHGYHAFGAFKDGELVGFVMGLCQSYNYQGKSLDGVLASWLAVDTERSSRLLSFKLIRRIFSSTFDRTAGRANDVMLFFTDRASGNEVLWERMAPQINARIIKKIGFFAKLFNVKKVIGSEWHHPWGHQLLTLRHFCDIPKAGRLQGMMRPFEKKDIADCLAFMNRANSTAALSRRWSKEELENHLQYGSLAHSLLYLKQGTLHGIITYHLLDFIGIQTVQGALVDFICLQGLRLMEEIQCISQSLRSLKHLGCDMVLVPENGITRKIPLWLTGFVSARRSMNLMISTETANEVTLKRNEKIFIECR